SPPRLRGERPGHGSVPRRPGGAGAERPDRPGDLPEAPRDDLAFAAPRLVALMALPAARAGSSRRSPAPGPTSSTRPRPEAGPDRADSLAPHAVAGRHGGRPGGPPRQPRRPA